MKKRELTVTLVYAPAGQDARAEVLAAFLAYLRQETAGDA